MNGSAGSFEFAAWEAKWQAYWEEHQTFRTPNPGEPGFDPARTKLYVLDMFPYPSGVGLHVGHPLGYIATDVYARFKRMRGFNVLHPMGYDAFGLPAEQYAVEHGVHPRITTERNIANIRGQFRRLGLGYDWNRELATTDVGYYRWTQWIFLQLYNSWYDTSADRARPIAELIADLERERLHVAFDGRLVSGPPSGMAPFLGGPAGARVWHDLSADEQRKIIDAHRLAYLDEVPVNWCPALGTVLANEEVTNEGRSERGNHPVFRRPLRQWMLRITHYGERLERDLDLVDWPESVKLMQRNWIGRSEGAEVDFHLADAGPDNDAVIRVYTTRPDTLFGATYMVLAPEHELVGRITTLEQREAVHAYVEAARAKSDLERTTGEKQKTGVFTGAYAVNPVNGERIPIWIADYVLMGYGTGAIMAVPAHDERDYAFAKAFGLPIRDVVYPRVVAAMKYFTEHAPAADQQQIAWPGRLAQFLILVTAQDAEPAQFGTLLAQSRGEGGGTVSRPPGAADALVWLDALDTYGFASFDDLRERFANADFYAKAGMAYTGSGVGVNSSNDSVSLNGVRTPDAQRLITDWLAERGLGQRAINYKLRDWLFSRQRYWGEPFPIVHDVETRHVYALDEAELPVELPEIDDFTPTASEKLDASPRPPLGRATAWANVDGYVTQSGSVRLVGPGRPAPAGAVVRRFQRELNTMPQWAGSCWYYLRYIDNRNDGVLVEPEHERYWMAPRDVKAADKLARAKALEEGDVQSYPVAPGPQTAGGVDLYVGGVEHAVLHLLYARFWHKVLYDLGHVSSPEPFGRLFNQGYIQAYAYQDRRGMYVDVKEVEERTEAGHTTYVHKGTGDPLTRSLGKMGKSLKNAVAPDEIIAEHGADALRIYELYMGPLETSKPWSTRDIVGMSRFLTSVWKKLIAPDGSPRVTDAAPEPALLRLTHKTIEKIGVMMDELRFNTAIAALIELNNAMKGEAHARAVVEPFVLMLAPFAPHMCEELWQRIRGPRWTGSIAHEAWPAFDPALARDESIEVPVQINGKLRSRVVVPAGASEDEMRTVALAGEKIQAGLAGREVVKVICVRGRLVNIVTR